MSLLHQRVWRLVVAATAHLHHLDAGLNVATMSVVDKVRQRHELVLERLPGRDATLLIHGQHPLEKVNEIASICLFGQQFAAFQFGGHVHLADVFQAVENVLASLFRFDASLGKRTSSSWLPS